MGRIWLAYRGHEIERDGDVWHVSRGGDRLHVANSEAAAMAWIDARKDRDRLAEKNRTRPKP